MESPALEFGREAFALLAGASWKAAALITAVWVALRLLRPSRPAVEHGIWTAALVATLLLPAVGLLGPAPPATLAIEAELPVLAEATAVSVTPGSSTDWRGLAGLLAVLVTSILLAHGLWQRLRVHQLISRAQAVTDPSLQRLSESLETGQTTKLVSTPEISTPLVFSGLRSVILLPETWSAWSPAKLRAVLLHELAHVERRDGWVMAAMSLTTTMFWFHPLAWLVRSRLMTLAEMACDDHAVREGRDRESYAEALLEIARSGQGKRTLPATLPAMARTARVAGRIERILEGRAYVSGILSGKGLRRLALAGLSAAVMLSLVSITFGQAGGIVLSGTVVDASGARVPRASVRIFDVSGDGAEATTSSADGSYTLSGLQPSTYDVEVQARGFSAQRQRVDLSSSQQLDIRLGVAPIEEVIIIAGQRPDDSSQPARPRQRTRVGGNVQKAKLLQHVQPIYPTSAQQEGVEGTVLLEAVISQEGAPMGLRAVNSVVDQRLVDAAIEAVRYWRYKPTHLNGQPVEVVTTMTVIFQLP